MFFPWSSYFIAICAQKVLIVSIKNQESPLKGQGFKSKNLTELLPLNYVKRSELLVLLDADAHKISQSGDCLNTGNLIYIWGWYSLLVSKIVRGQWDTVTAITLRYSGSHPPCLNTAPFRWKDNVCILGKQTEDFRSIELVLGRVFFQEQETVQMTDT